MRRSERKYDKAHTSQCLTGWPSGPGRDSTTRGTHLAGLVLWQISLKMGVRLQYITMQDSGLVSQNDFTQLFHYLLQKMTPCPEESRTCAETSRGVKHSKGEDLKECRFNFLDEWLRHNHWVLFFFFLSLQSEVFFSPLCSKNKTWPWTNDADRPECSSNQVCRTLSPNKHFCARLPGNIKLKSLK